MLSSSSTPNSCSNFAFINSINKNSRVVSIPAKNISQKGEEEVSSETNVVHFDFSGLA